MKQVKKRPEKQSRAPSRKTLAEVLMDMPDVGVDEDFARGHEDDPLKLLDPVALLASVRGVDLLGSEVQLVRGQVGTVIDISGDVVVVVEFAGLDGVAYAQAFVPCTTLLRLRHEGPAVGI